MMVAIHFWRGWQSHLAVFVFAMVATDAHAQDMAFRSVGMQSLRDCAIIAEGPISSETPNQFLRFLSEDPWVSECSFIVLRSPGGNLAAGIRLGRIFRANGFETVVDSRCQSACAYAFLGGASRASRTFEEYRQDGYGSDAEFTGEPVISNLALGFHQFYSEAGVLSSAEAQLVAAEVIGYVLEMGVDARIFVTASQRGPLEMHYPSFQELLSYDVISTNGFQSFFLEPYRNGVIAVSRHEGLRFGRPALVQQLTALCRGGRAELLLSLPDAARAPGSSLLSANYDTIPLFLGPQGEGTGWNGWNEVNATIRRSGDRDLVSARLSSRDVQALLNAERMEIWLDVARAFGSNSYERRLTETDRSMLRAAFRHCID